MTRVGGLCCLERQERDRGGGGAGGGGAEKREGLTEREAGESVAPVV